MSDHQKSSWWRRLTSGLNRSSGSLAEGLRKLLVNRTLDDDTLDELEDLLIQSDMGVDTAISLIDDIRTTGFDPEQGLAPVLTALSHKISARIQAVEKPFIRTAGDNHLEVILVIGVNGAGKTTTIGKLAEHLMKNGEKVIMAAADTFRAAAIDQLRRWSDRSGAPIITADQGSDPSALVYRAIEQAKEGKADYLIIDTAGRLHNKNHLMDELGKIKRVIAKQTDDRPHQVLLVLDATTGQNALHQADAFMQTADVSGLIMTKLDGSAKGGVLVALAEKTALPIYFIGVGEQAEDLLPFNAQAFSEALVGLDQTGAV